MEATVAWPAALPDAPYCGAVTGVWGRVPASLRLWHAGRPTLPLLLWLQLANCRAPPLWRW